MAATKANKTLKAQTEKFSARVKCLEERVKELEGALLEAVGSPDHPLLQDQASSEKDINEVSEGIGALIVSEDGRTRYQGEGAASEYLLDMIIRQEGGDQPDPSELCLPSEIVALVNAFPFGVKKTRLTKAIFAPYIPTRERTLQLTDLYFKHLGWLYEPITRQDLMSSIIDPLYPHTGNVANPLGSDTVNVDAVSSHRLSVLFFMLCCGLLHEPDEPSASPASNHSNGANGSPNTATGWNVQPAHSSPPTHPTATAQESKFLSAQYQALGRAALALEPVLWDVSCATVQALFLLIILLDANDRKSNEERWMLVGVCARAVPVLGLQRDGGSWGFDNEEVERRRRLFWELYILDGCTSITNGRPPSLMLQQTDTRFPVEYGPDEWDKMTFHDWMQRFASCCLNSVVRYAFCTRGTTYKTLLELDRKIRTFPVPKALRPPEPAMGSAGAASVGSSASGSSSRSGVSSGSGMSSGSGASGSSLNGPGNGANGAADGNEGWSPDPCIAMQQMAILNEKEANLLYLHRRHFGKPFVQPDGAHIPVSSTEQVMASPFAPSFLATYRSATRLVRGMRSVHAVHPEMTERQWHFWTSVFSACLVLGATCIHGGDTPFTKEALQELEEAVEFFERGSRRCRHAGTMPSLERLLRQSRACAKGDLPPGGECITGTDREICLLACPQKWFLKKAATAQTVSADAIRAQQAAAAASAAAASSGDRPVPDVGAWGDRWALYPPMGGDVDGVGLGWARDLVGGQIPLTNPDQPPAASGQPSTTSGQTPLANGQPSLADGQSQLPNANALRSGFDAMFGYGQQGYSASPDYTPFGMVGMAVPGAGAGGDGDITMGFSGFGFDGGMGLGMGVGMGKGEEASLGGTGLSTLNTGGAMEADPAMDALLRQMAGDAGARTEAMSWDALMKDLGMDGTR
ncbi:uncharacterized protein SCHCODRAFT_02617794 [Schizophyllum commune H4-8]|nr:uncharacterized protein SCHCODRAFT_02617794 [Schizophyllum commune H4-8]KAI5894781.1 hypothetical protein SCHCODRAFT_02617794 [Schizophyllum commune H4-8]